MFANQSGLTPSPAREAPPHWAVLTVKCCVVGILTLPLAVLLLGPVGAALGVAESFYRVAFFTAPGVWLAMFVLAEYLTTVYPPVPRRRR